eukprot:CAMPEP_0172592054 /NCGR_PEP_ID=MMETSP1068-20121228/10939_1 /TAXON_ID=35684 /ORGANISM="Pseudopedinella elastica, Strain CCMP716" /LENGTH=102 /DNA_ID=CAMNT_0013388845 /DNA_START=402 /DNA_END=710 /DNA_ORIENTATION=-
MTFLPSLLRSRTKNPCFRFRRMVDGWKVRLIAKIAGAASSRAGPCLNPASDPARASTRLRTTATAPSSRVRSRTYGVSTTGDTAILIRMLLAETLKTEVTCA